MSVRDRRVAADDVDDEVMENAGGAHADDLPIRRLGNGVCPTPVLVHVHGLEAVAGAEPTEALIIKAERNGVRDGVFRDNA